MKNSKQNLSKNNCKKNLLKLKMSRSVWVANALLVSISPTFYVQLLRSWVPKAPNDTADLTVIFCAFEIYVHKSCTYVDEIEPWYYPILG